MNAAEIVTAIASLFIALATTLIALAALGIAVWQGAETRRHHRNAARPWLQFHVELSTKSSLFGVHLQNKGVAPARVTGFTVELDGSKLDADWQALWIALFDKLGGASDWLEWVKATSINPGGCHISVGETLPVISAFGPRLTPGQLESFHGLLERAVLTVEYQSVYGEEFKSNTAGMIPDPLNRFGACGEEAHPRRQK